MIVLWFSDDGFIYSFGIYKLSFIFGGINWECFVFNKNVVVNFIRVFIVEWIVVVLNNLE